MNEDVVSLILEHIYFDSNNRPDFHNLAHYARISRAWRNPAQRLLFHTLIIDDDHSWESSMAAFDSQKSGAQAIFLRHAVRILEFPRISRSQAFRERWEERLPIVLQLFPFLYELRLYISGLDKLSQLTLRELEKSPPIVALLVSMHNSPVSTCINSIIPLQLLQVQRWKLRFLALPGQRFAHQRHKEFKPVQHKLYSLELSCPTGNDEHENSEPFVKWVLGASQGSLKRLWTTILSGAFVPFLSNLDSLGYERDYVPTAIRGSTWQWRANLSNLQELITPATYAQPLNDPHNTPTRVKHILVAGWGEICKDSYVLTYLENLPHTVEVLTICTDRSKWSPSKSTLSHYLARGVRLRMLDRQTYCWKPYDEVDRVEVQGYALEKTPDAIRLMNMAVAHRVVDGEEVVVKNLSLKPSKSWSRFLKRSF